MSVNYHQGKFPPDERLDWTRIIPHLGPTSAAVARFDGTLSTIPNPEILLTPLTTLEAVLSSRIEGIHATIKEVLGFEAGQKPQSPERRRDISEVLNYQSAMGQAKHLLQTLPLSQKVIRSVHTTLLSGVRGKSSAPDKYRSVPNWIGPPGCTVDEARFVPIEAYELPDAMSTWEKYMHARPLDRLAQLAILHAEFESLHPFLDGNGRLGRMLVPLFLWQFELIRAPTFYISEFLEANRDDYYEGLLAVSSNDDWTGWIIFFLKAVRRQAEDNLDKANNINELYENMKLQVAELTKSNFAILALDRIFERPIFSTSSFYCLSGIPKSSSARILSVLRDANILQVLVPGRGRRPTILIVPALLNIVEAHEDFVAHQ